MSTLSLHANTSLQATLSPCLQMSSLLQAPASLPAHLLGQINVLQIPNRDRELAAAVVACLDDDGYLRLPLNEVGQALYLLPEARPQELSIALCRVQALDPLGVGARSVAECLALQLPAIACPAQRQLASEIVEKHLDLLAARDTRTLARRLERELVDVEAACTAIRRLDPHPGWRYGEPSTAYITPDVIARKRRGRWVAPLNEVGVNESTVSRVTNNKFLDTPYGVFELKYFSRGLSTASGGECSLTAIRGLIQEMILAESPDAPMSDVLIASELSRQGFKVARRTITKYRQLLRIEPAQRRRSVAPAREAGA